MNANAYLNVYVQMPFLLFMSGCRIWFAFLDAMEQLRIDLLVADIDKENQTMEVDEKDAQKDYETFMADASEKRAQDSKAITDKEGAKAETETELEADTEDKKSKTIEAMETAKYTLLIAIHLWPSQPLLAVSAASPVPSLLPSRPKSAVISFIFFKKHLR